MRRGSHALPRRLLMRRLPSAHASSFIEHCHDCLQNSSTSTSTMTRTSRSRKMKETPSRSPDPGPGPGPGASVVSPTAARR
ncbi:hypothetical protein EJ05DRAFT_109112 [Pseudovirgaria hyperparasitica]|uniref:Uncharacterized protein n=1 Tax=Pseudovirgaria hyperparasitica TaxID=470096 RepID=A0A6A6VZH8_9PEZI|nr:uncharacterized protein EJ05DRAFT_109112 [Pseudovirgaria hyperparasitica]KAF2755635.1 hypothetical protein EJ05DRAFT_109112 [Pseudovirgaria hyperparasitica]